MLGLHESDQIGATTEGDVWQELSVSAVAPAGTVNIQAVATFWQCKDDTTGGNCWDGNGGVYFDDLSFTESAE